MDQTYREITDKMEKAKVNPDYILGWQGGYLRHPTREEQRATEAYKAGYEDGKSKETNKYQNWAT